MGLPTDDKLWLLRLNLRCRAAAFYRHLQLFLITLHSVIHSIYFISLIVYYYHRSVIFHFPPSLFAFLNLFFYLSFLFIFYFTSSCYISIYFSFLSLFLAFFIMLYFYVVFSSFFRFLSKKNWIHGLRIKRDY